MTVTLQRSLFRESANPEGFFFCESFSTIKALSSQKNSLFTQIKEELHAYIYIYIYIYIYTYIFQPLIFRGHASFPESITNDQHPISFKWIGLGFMVHHPIKRLRNFNLNPYHPWDCGFDERLMFMVNVVNKPWGTR